MPVGAGPILQRGECGRLTWAPELAGKEIGKTPYKVSLPICQEEIYHGKAARYQ